MHPSGPSYRAWSMLTPDAMYIKKTIPGRNGRHRDPPMYIGATREPTSYAGFKLTRDREACIDP